MTGSLAKQDDSDRTGTIQGGQLVSLGIIKTSEVILVSQRNNILYNLLFIVCGVCVISLYVH